MGRRMGRRKTSFKWLDKTFCRSSVALCEWGRRCSSVVEHWCSTGQALDSIPSNSNSRKHLQKEWPRMLSNDANPLTATVYVWGGPETKCEAWYVIVPPFSGDATETWGCHVRAWNLLSCVQYFIESRCAWRKDWKQPSFSTLPQGN